MKQNGNVGSTDSRRSISRFMDQNGNVGSTDSRRVLVDLWNRTVALAALIVDVY